MEFDVSQGDYARKQIYCPSRVVAWSHGSRFKLAARLADQSRGGRLLDYGCGDGTFIALTHGMFSRAVGADVDADQLVECRRRLGALEHVEFVPTATLAVPERSGTFDLVTCMEVLEHCTDVERVRVISELARLCAANGRIIISVPIEIGPALLGKQLFRAIAAWRGHGDYHHRETYTPSEMMAAVLGRHGLVRPEYPCGYAVRPGSLLRPQGIRLAPPRTRPARGASRRATDVHADARTARRHQ